MQLSRDGAQLFAAALSPCDLQSLEQAFARLPSDRPGIRPDGLPELEAALAPAHRIASQLLGSSAKAVRAKLFDKNPQTNWSLGWHQDRTIAVRARTDTTGFTDWTRKSGIHHVVPPFDYLERMLTLRIHLDAVAETNAPLLIAPGRHRLGRVPEAEIVDIVARHGTYACLAGAGDIWAYSTPILHASARAADPTRRRVLQILYSADELPSELEWLGI